MGRDETITLLRSHSAEIRERFGVKRLAVFGSTVRNEARDDSDVDVLVEHIKLFLNCLTGSR